jgi:dihydropyrimidinase
MSSILIKNGEVLTGSERKVADVLVIKGKIKAVGPELEAVDSHTDVIDATGRYVMPGGIDPHVHMELPAGGGMYSSDDFESGSRAAIAGGTTTIIDFVTPEKGQRLMEAARERKAASAKSLCDYGLHMSVTCWTPRTPDELKLCVQQEGMTSVKLYMAYKRTIGLEDENIRKVMRAAARLNMLVMVHCEHGNAVTYLQKRFISEGKTEPRFHPMSRPPEVEIEAVKRALQMAETTGCRLYIVHVSTGKAMADIEQARAAAKLQKRSMTLFTETCPQYLLLDDREYLRPGFEAAAYVISPPLRTWGNRAELWKGLQRGQIQSVATDHCPFHMKGQKERGLEDFTRIPNGAAGVEHRLMLLYRYGVLENIITPEQWVNLTATQPARIFGLYPRKGTIAVGSDADIVIWNPDAKDTISAANHHQNCDTTIYEGFQVKGKPGIVITNGKIAYNEGKFMVEEGAGKYLHRGICCE